MGKDGFASGKTGTTEAEALEYDSKMMEKVPLESENSWTALDCLHEPTRTQQPLSQWSFNFILAEGGRARLASSEKGTKAGHRVGFILRRSIHIPRDEVHLHVFPHGSFLGPNEMGGKQRLHFRQTLLCESSSLQPWLKLL